MLFGTLLFSVPLLIHLFNKRRYRIKQWAAMEFLMAAFKRTRRRLRLENIILLLIRCLIIILLALAMARPFVSSDSLASALVSARRDVVVVLDNSFSMDYRITPDETCFDLAKKKISALLNRLDGARGDTATLVLMEMIPELVVPFHSSPQEALARLERLRSPSFQSADFSSLAVFLAGEMSTSIEGVKEVYIFTDLQGLTLGREEGQSRAATAKLIKQAKDKGARISFVDVGPQIQYPPNAAVVEVNTLEPYVTTELPTTFIATVRNYGDKEVLDCRGAFMLDGKALETRTLNLKPRNSATAECTVRISDPGFHNISFRLERDNLPIDDELWRSLDAREAVKILIVDGSYPDDSVRSSASELMWVINPARMDGGGDKGTVFDSTTVDFKQFNAGRVDLISYDLVILADVEGFSEEMTDVLLNYVQGGGSAVFFMGDMIDSTAWNHRLFSETETNLLPCSLGQSKGESERSDSVEYFKLSVPDLSHPIFEVFNDPRYKALLEVPFFKFISVENMHSDAKIIANFTDSLDRSYPAIIEKNVGSGKTVLFTTSLSSSWNLLSESPVTFLPLVHSLLYHLTARDMSLHNLKVGYPIYRTTADFPEAISITWPDGSKQLISDPVEERIFDRYILPLSNYRLDEMGAFRLEVDFSQASRNIYEYYTANIDPKEGDMRRFDPETLDNIFPDCDLKVLFSAVTEDFEEDQNTGKGEMWRSLLMALVLLIGLESFLSWKFGNYR